MDEAEIQREAEGCYSQFISSKPDRTSFLMGFHAGAAWASYTPGPATAKLLEVLAIYFDPPDNPPRTFIQALVSTELARAFIAEFDGGEGQGGEGP